MFSPLTERRTLGALRSRRAAGNVGPVVVVSQDSFAGVSGELLTAHVGEIGAIWTTVSGNHTRLSGSNSIYHSSTGESWHACSGAPPSINYFVEAQLQMRSSMIGVNDGANIFVRHNGGRRVNVFYSNTALQWQLYGPDDLMKVTSTEDLPTTTFWPNLRLSCVDRLYRFYVGSVLRMEWTDSADSVAPGFGALRFFNVSVPSTNNSKLHFANYQLQGL